MRFLKMLLVCVIAAVLMGIGTPEVTAQEPVPEAPVPTVPGIFTLQGELTRIAYNMEGWVTLGYREANASQGQDWLMLEVGLSLRKPNKNQTLTRESFSIKMPDGSIVPLATQKEYNGAGYLRALNTRANTIRDSINYFPVEANQGCPISFFSDPTKAGSISRDQVELSFRRACLGRLFFKMPEGKKIVTGQYWLYTDFAGSQVQTPFRILTKEEQKYLKKNWKDLKKQHEAFLNSQAEKAKQQ